jgi:hypothetical protein
MVQAAIYNRSSYPDVRQPIKNHLRELANPKLNAFRDMFFYVDVLGS